MPTGTATVATSATVPLRAAAGAPAAVADDHRDDDAEQDAQGVGADRDRSEVPHAPVGLGR
jgi:hypothetical protein